MKMEAIDVVDFTTQNWVAPGPVVDQFDLDLHGLVERRVYRTQGREGQEIVFHLHPQPECFAIQVDEDTVDPEESANEIWEFLSGPTPAPTSA